MSVPLLYFSFLKYSQIVAEAPRIDPVIVAIAVLLLAFSKLGSNGTNQSTSFAGFVSNLSLLGPQYTLVRGRRLPCRASAFCD